MSSNIRTEIIETSKQISEQDTSTYEQKANKFLSNTVEKESFIRMDKYNYALFIIDKLLIKCDELRKSRDNWKKKYEKTNKNVNGKKC